MSEIAYYRNILNSEYAALDRANSWVARAEREHDAALDAYDYDPESYEVVATATVLASMHERVAAIVRQIDATEAELRRLEPIDD